MIKISNISLAFDTHVLIKKGDLNIPDGQITLLTGESGSGKTTLLMDIGLLSHRADMKYDFNGLFISECDEKEMCILRRNEISFIFQENYLFEHMNLIENIRFFANLMHRTLSDEEIHEYLDFVDLDLDFQTPLHSMSGGERQRLAIVCGIVKDAKLFIFDEPTSHLDEQNKQKIISIIKDLGYIKHKMVIIASHDHIFLDVADQIYQIQNQKIVSLQTSHFIETKNEFKNEPIHKKALYEYVWQKNKRYSIIVGIILGIFLMGFAVSFIYGTIYQKNDEVALLNSIHHHGMLIREDGKIMSVTEQTRLKQKLVDFQIFSYIETTTSLKCQNRVLNQVNIKPYYDYSIGTMDILEKRHEMTEESIYVSYEIYHYFKENIFTQLSFEELGNVTIDAVLRPNYDIRPTIYIPYSFYEQYYQSQGIDLLNTPLKYMVISLRSLEDYQMVSQSIESPHHFVTNPVIDDQVKLMQLFGSIYLLIAWIFALIILLIYNTYRLIGDKHNIALLETLGVDHMNLVKMKFFEETMILGMTIVCATLYSFITTVLLSIGSWQSMFLIFGLIMMNGLLIACIDIIIFVFLIKRYSTAILF